MEKFIPREKLSKRAQNALNAKKRRTWGAISPVTRKPNNPKAYDRNKTRRWTDDGASGPYSFPGYAASGSCAVDVNQSV
jgi:hypothetical protein